MKKRILLTASLALILGVAGMAQEKLFMGVNVESPVKNADGTVTFNLFAPDAMKVSVTGDFLPTKKIQTPRGDYDAPGDRKSTRLNSSHANISYAVFCLKKKKKTKSDLMT